MNKPLLEAVKEALRLALMSVIPVVIYQLETNNLDYRLLTVLSAIAVLKALDKWLHESNKELPKAEQNDGFLGKKGLTGF